MDVVIELVGGDTCMALLHTLRPDGLLISAQAAWVPGLDDAAAALGVRASWYLVEPSGSGLDALARLAANGQLRCHVQSVSPLADAASVHARVSEGRSMGKLILVPPSS